MKDKIIIFDTTLRDGEQSPGFGMTVEQKCRMARQLERLCVDVIEAGFPISSKGDFEAVKMISKEIKKCTVAALARARHDDIKCAWEALRNAANPRIHTFIATSDIHLKYKLNMEKAEVLNAAVESVRYAKSLTRDVEFSAEDAVRTDREFLFKIIEAVIDSGATVINIPDTVGYATPKEFGDLIRSIINSVPNIGKAVLSIHCHNDLGLASSNSLTAIENGATQVECTINGIGERAGNAALEEIVMTLHTRRDIYDKKTGVKIREIYRTSRLLSHLTGIPVQPNKAIVGENAFAHEAGIHQHGILKHNTTYEIITPQSVGVPSSRLVLGKHSGRHALARRYAELGINLSAEKLNNVYREFTNLADKKKIISDDDLIDFIQRIKNQNQSGE